jgi:TolA-binding protein
LALRIFMFAMCGFLLSCSLLQKTRRNILDEDDPAKQKVVPKAQYDELMRKYENAARSKNQNSDVVYNNDAYNSVKGDNPPLERIKVGGVENNELVETVDVFSNDQGNPNKAQVKGNVVVKKQKNKAQVAVKKPSMGGDGIRNEIVLFRRAMGFVQKGQNDNAMKIFQTLESSPYSQIQVRAKYQIGELLYNQSEYDLALQTYESIIQKYAFSGMVIPSLKKLVLCSEKLNAKDKKDKYQSILVDIFERQL